MAEIFGNSSTCGPGSNITDWGGGNHETVNKGLCENRLGQKSKKYRELLLQIFDDSPFAKNL